MQNPPQEILDQWQLTLIAPVAETGAARVWKVLNSGGTAAALKLYHRPDRGNEAAGSEILSSWQDRGAVRILKETGTAILMEWLEGPTLGDIARRGEYGQALVTLAETAKRLHAKATPQISGLRPLTQVFRPLLECQFAPSCPADLVRDMQQATQLAQSLLNSQTRITPLHGDLHPDNVILSGACPRVIDAKGYLGDLAFELANAIRHPKGMPQLVRQPDHMNKCLSLYADTLGVDRQRLAQWAAAKCALSIYWRASGPLAQDKEADLLRMLLNAANQ
ncbi:aminoglycoside phosphotransferase family protein [Ruegeria sp. SCPT10]|uniref:aminoglycoside phosphotransferase family protein n=1 Tax=Ruegeria sp. SCP10 TaxID=3141377 RepID=UPI003334E3F4